MYWETWSRSSAIIPIKLIFKISEKNILSGCVSRQGLTEWAPYFFPVGSQLFLLSRRSLLVNSQSLTVSTDYFFSNVHEVYRETGTLFHSIDMSDQLVFF